MFYNEKFSIYKKVIKGICEKKKKSNYNNSLKVTRN